MYPHAQQQCCSGIPQNLQESMSRLIKPCADRAYDAAPPNRVVATASPWSYMLYQQVL